MPGETLSCVIIDKLPFAAPNDPLVAARLEKIAEAGGNPFWDYQVPSAVLALRQGLGRLIRRASDQGILAVLDGRLFKRSYGKIFLESLPESNYHPPARRYWRVLKLATSPVFAFRKIDANHGPPYLTQSQP